MKNFNLIILLFFISIIANAQLREMKNGVIIPPHGEFRALIVFVDIDYSQSVCPCNYGPGDDYAPSWPVINGVTQVPTDAHTYFNPNLTSFQSNPAFITDYFYQASFGSYKLFGDYYPKVIKVNCNEVNFGNGLNLILGKLQQEPLQNGTLYSASGLPLSAFDSWTPTAQGFQKLNTSDNKIDLLYIIWRNNKFLNGCGATDYSGFGVTSANGIAFAGMDGVTA
ncbi:MAG: hypothetical protein M3Q58_10855, partial [Bacteroidota bacterium]|nr:hypothetical protein [Bacteroidota bacterium]